MAVASDRGDDSRARPWTWILATLLVGIPALAVLAFFALFDPNDFKPEILDRARAATGRELTLGGPIRLKWALRPTVEVTDVSFANWEGGTRAQMLRVGRSEVRLGLLALLQRRLEIDRLILEKPEILLESDAEGRGNWNIVPARGRTPASDGLTQASGPRSPPSAGFAAIGVREVRITDGVLHWRQAGKPALELPITQLDLDAEDEAAPLGIKLKTQWNGVAVGVNGQVGALGGLQGNSGTPWPLRMAISAGGAMVHLSGHMTGGFANSGPERTYQLKLTGTAPDLAALAPLLATQPGGLALPLLREVVVAAQLTGRGNGWPEVTDLSLRAGVSDLGADLHGLKLDRLDISAENLADAVKIDAQVSAGAVPMVLAAHIGAPLAVLGGQGVKPMSVAISLTASGAAVSARGQIADPARMGGVDVKVAASVPDLQVFGSAMGDTLPALRDLRVQARLVTGSDGLGQGLALRELAVNQAQIDMSGDVALRFHPTRAIQANLAARIIDLDALRSAAPTAPLPPGRAGRSGGKIIPDTALPVALLRTGDADIQIAVDTLMEGGASIKNLVAKLVLRDGQLKIDPFSAELPAGKISGSMTVDATPPAPPVALVLHSPGLALKRIYNDMGRDGEATGLLEVDLDLRGAGSTWRQIAAGADGHLGLAIVGGAIDNRMLNFGVIGDVLRALNLGDALGRGGVSQLRCFALRIDARGGIGEVRSLFLDASNLWLEGGGRLNLAEEGLALRAKVQPRLGSLSVTVPVRVGGSFAAPRVAPDPGGLLAGAGGEVGSSDSCAGPLAMARGGRGGLGLGASPMAPTQGGQRQPRGGRSNNPLQRLLP